MKMAAGDGAYLIHVEGSNVENIALFLKTGMIVVGKPLTDSVQYMAANSATGKPLAGVQLTIKETYYDYKYGYERRVKITKAKTGADGRYTYNFTKGQDISSNSAEFFARQGDSMAMSHSQYPTYYYRGDTDETYKIFTITDRPVYRPGDKVRLSMSLRAWDLYP